MKRRGISLICTLLILAAGLVHAQEQCGTAAKMIPSIPAGVADLQRIRDNIAGSAFAKQQGDTLIFPAVVHVIHNAGVGNISDSQIVDGLRIVNEDFNRENADTSVTRSLFKPYAAAVGFRFVLAKLDSNGDSTSGIVRIDTSIIPHPEPTNSNFDNCKRLSAWPPDMYYNIWIVRSIQSGTLGYAQYPGTNFTYGGPWKTWGIVVKHNQWGTIGTSSADGRTGTHEIGHTFGLYHTFLSTSADCGSVCDTTGDEVCDTPPSTYITGSCPTTQNTCANDTVGSSPFDSNIVDQIENYMSYKTCQNMFSEGQKTRMRGFIAEFSILQGLSSDSNLFATGLIDTIPLHIKDDVRDGFVISVSPNPFYDEITLLVPKDLNTDRNNIRLINLLGQEMNYSIQYNYMIRNEQSVTLQVPSDLKSGLYFLKVGRNIAKVVKE